MICTADPEKTPYILSLRSWTSNTLADKLKEKKNRTKTEEAQHAATAPSRRGLHIADVTLPPGTPGRTGDWSRHTEPSTGNAFWLNKSTGDTVWAAISTPADNDSSWEQLYDPNSQRYFHVHVDTGAVEWGPVISEEHGGDTAAQRRTTGGGREGKTGAGGGEGKNVESGGNRSSAYSSGSLGSLDSVGDESAGVHPKGDDDHRSKGDSLAHYKVRLSSTFQVASCHVYLRE